MIQQFDPNTPPRKILIYRRKVQMKFFFQTRKYLSYFCNNNLFESINASSQGNPILLNTAISISGRYELYIHINSYSSY